MVEHPTLDFSPIRQVLEIQDLVGHQAGVGLFGDTCGFILRPCGQADSQRNAQTQTPSEPIACAHVDMMTNLMGQHKIQGGMNSQKISQNISGGRDFEIIRKA
jgi:hypothetical protein